MTKTPVGGYQPVKDLKRLAEIPDVVCRIVKSNQTTPNDGTGFLIGNGLLMTCSHVLYSEDECTKSQAVFFHTHPTNEFRVDFDPEACFINSPSPGKTPAETGKLDFTIVALDLSDQHVREKLIRINKYAINVFNGVVPKKGMTTHIFQHPYEKDLHTEGIVSDLKYSTGAVSKVVAPSYYYSNKTSDASSGSAVVGVDGRLLGIHRAAGEGVILDMVRRSFTNENINLIKSFWNKEPAPSQSALQKALRTRYSQDDIKFLPEFIPSSERSPISEYFTKLSIVPKEEQENREKQSTDFSSSTKDSLRQIHDRMQKTVRDLEICDLFSSTNKVLVIGRAGIGKSALCQKIAYDWGQGKLWGERFEFAYLLRLRDIDEIFLKTCSSLSTDEFLSQALAKYCLKQELNTAVVTQLNQKRSSTLLVLDGYDEAGENLKDRLRPLFRDSNLHILLTSRPEATMKLHKLFKFQVENMGFSDAHIKKYIHSYFKDSKTSDTFHTLLKSKQNHFAIAHIPLQLEILCNLWEEGKAEFPETLTQMMEEMVSKLHEWQCKRGKDKDGNKIDPDSITEDEKKTIQTILGKIALSGLEKNALLIDKKTYTESLGGTKNTIKELQKTGLLKFTEKNKKIYFLHLTYQEYMTALLVSRQSKIAQEKFVLSHINHPQFRLVIRMLTHILGEPVLSWINSVDLYAKYKCKLILECLSECKSENSIWKEEDAVEMVKTLMNKISFPILNWAIEKNLGPVIRWLVTDCKADVNAKGSTGRTPLHYAAGSGNLELVKCLVSVGKADVNAKSNYESTPLHDAARSGHLDIVKWLVTEGKADANAKGNNGTTPLHTAAGSGNLDIVKWLVTDCKADVNAKNNDGETPLHYAAKSGNLELVKWLVSVGKADINAKNKYGSPLLRSAARSGNLELVKCLVSEGKADVNGKDKYGSPLLHYAARSGNLELVKWLVTEGKADVNGKDGDGEPPLHDAARSGNLELVKWLVSEGKADVNGKDKYGSPLLHYAARSGNLELVKWLVTEGKADANAKDGDGETPRRLAKTFNKIAVAQWLKSHSVNLKS